MSSTPTSDRPAIMLRLSLRLGLVLIAGFTLLASYTVLAQRRDFPDVGTIVFTMGKQNAVESFIYALKPNNSLGDGRHQVFDQNPPEDMVQAVACSPDGRSIVFHFDGDLYRLNVETDDLVKITANPVGLVTNLALSPDGTVIAYIPVFTGDGDVLFMTFGGAHPFQMPATPYREYAAAWSPDGSRIAFAATEAAGYPTQYAHVIEIMNVATLTTQTIFRTSANIPPVIAWSPDGSRIAFSMQTDIYTIQPDGSQLDRLTDNDRYNLRPQWSPDGSLISYSSEGDTQTAQLWAMNADGSNPYLVYWRLPDYDVYNQCWLSNPPQD